MLPAQPLKSMPAAPRAWGCRGLAARCSVGLLLLVICARAAPPTSVPNLIL